LGIRIILEATKPNFNLVKQIKDDKIDVDHLENYKLTLHIGTKEFQISIFDTNNKCLLIEDYNLRDANTSDEVIEILIGIIESHELLKAGFWKEIKVSFRSKKSTLIPSPLFEGEHSEEYLQLIGEVDPESEEVQSFVHHHENYVSVYATDKKILNWLKSLYSTIPVKSLHQSCVLIEGILHYEDHPSSEGVFIYLNKTDLHIIVTARKQLQYYNTFTCGSPEEFIRYILLVFQELRLNPNHAKVILWGNFDDKSPYYKNIYKYIRHISFAKKPSYLKLNFQFDELHDHEYLDLYSIYLC
jgi:hypothetical protein